MDLWRKITDAPRGELRHRCAQPGCTSHLMREQMRKCVRCGLARYCSVEHQFTHWSEHEDTCDVMTDPQVAPNNDIKELISTGRIQPNTGPPIYAITREYMMAQIRVMALLWQHGNLDCCREALKTIEFMMLFDASDARQIRATAAVLMLRLDEDQRCYDLIKRCATAHPAPGKSYHDATYDPTGDPFEDDPSFLWDDVSVPNFDHLIAALMLKLKLLVDIRNLKVAQKVLTACSPLPPELCAIVQTHVIRSPLSTRLLKTGDEKHEERTRLLEVEHKLARHVREIGIKIGEINRTFFTKLLIKPHMAVEDIVNLKQGAAWDLGKMKEAEKAFERSYMACRELDGVLELMQELLNASALEHVEEVGAIMNGEMGMSAMPQNLETFIFEEFEEGEPLFAEVCLGRNLIWKSLGAALQNFAFLGPAEDMPSDRKLWHTQNEDDNGNWKRGMVLLLEWTSNSDRADLRERVRAMIM